MVMLAKLIGIIITAAGVVFLTSPGMAKKLLTFLEEGNRIWGMAVVRVVVGLILLAASGQSSIPWLVFVIGILPIIGGILIPILGIEKSKKIMREWKGKPDSQFRALSFIPLIMGVLLLLAV